jgi:hypothetical protein
MVWPHLTIGAMSAPTGQAFMVKKEVGGLAQICLKMDECSLCFGHLVHLIIFAITLFDQLGLEMSRSSVH